MPTSVVQVPLVFVRVPVFTWSGTRFVACLGL
jgi:hypothetical protein